ncbi:ABC transporter ATP-binding protein (plasmid) [Rhizobium sp. TRM96647]|uniref:ABC transporter ATP-binding protein n=1 Tax=unclassified Rhizobium TaxID=2613769 RepID=UPI0021E99164|nr:MULTISPECIES: ABC transporter ATP-binding protein [unclassified Rhizobium]MCV3735162.1 ABC transporter ATP-binding protein [Rhizobium sp. TRM96647]MCV3758074.1 ABC transporter ATP-binding protein [Rhizobium sp. TRM96650]
MLEVQGANLSYGGVRAVNDVSLRVEAGKIVGLIGTNGAGKTSLFNVISGFVRSDSGRIAFEGKDISRTDPSEIALSGLMRTFQTPVGFPRMTVLENMMVFSRPEKTLRQRIFGPAVADKAVIDEALIRLDAFGLSARANHWAQDLSAPELKMLEFARAMMAKPRLLMLDEPAAGVNPAMLDSLAARIRDMRDEGITFLVVDHNLKFICDVCEEIYAMADGKVIAHGTPQEVTANKAVIELYIGSQAAS